MTAEEWVAIGWLVGLLVVGIAFHLKMRKEDP